MRTLIASSTREYAFGHNPISEDEEMRAHHSGVTIREDRGMPIEPSQGMGLSSAYL
jgi:hypothetical protein